MGHERNLTAQNSVILACTSMLLHVAAAQEKIGTHLEVVELDQALHEDPKKMRKRILAALDMLPGQIETVLVAMGRCGGSWDDIAVSRRVVIPKVDDCITLLLHTDDAPHENLKEDGHMYFRDCDTGGYTIQGIKDRLCQEYGMEVGTSIFGGWFAPYTHADIRDCQLHNWAIGTSPVAFSRICHPHCVCVGCPQLSQIAVLVSNRFPAFPDVCP